MDWTQQRKFFNPQHGPAVAEETQVPPLQLDEYPNTVGLVQDGLGPYILNQSLGDQKGCGEYLMHEFWAI